MRYPIEEKLTYGDQWWLRMSERIINGFNNAGCLLLLDTNVLYIVRIECFRVKRAAERDNFQSFSPQ